MPKILSNLIFQSICRNTKDKDFPSISLLSFFFFFRIVLRIPVDSILFRHISNLLVINLSGKLKSIYILALSLWGVLSVFTLKMKYIPTFSYLI